MPCLPGVAMPQETFRSKASRGLCPQRSGGYLETGENRGYMETGENERPQCRDGPRVHPRCQYSIANENEVISIWTLNSGRGTACRSRSGRQN